MAIYRNIQLSFWTDSKIVDDFTPEDRYFYLYLLTNPHTNLAGCYEVSFKQISDEIGYTKETIEKLLDRMEKIHEVIEYSPTTKEILIKNYHVYNWNKSPKFLSALSKDIAKVKEPSFKKYLEDLSGSVDTHEEEEVPDNSEEEEKKKKRDEQIKQIIDYLNEVTESAYRYSSKSTRSHINARLEEGFSVDDFKKVIDNKNLDWKNSQWEKFLRPETLFGSKFENYLNQKNCSTDGSAFDHIKL